MSTTPLPSPDFHATPVPLLRTDVPGPRARAFIARDRAVTSPSLARVHPLVPAQGS
ncbi:MAG TPA: aspartate aminotransferase family protein, partial [Acidimicrobiia bacterium]|nr:aspartate aminotransferase family protein [Acidimicrobiia bacterium]